MNIYCFLRMLWWNLPSLFMPPMTEGHVLVVDEEVENATVYIAYCKDCGKQEISFTTNGRKLDL